MLLCAPLVVSHSQKCFPFLINSLKPRTWCPLNSVLQSGLSVSISFSDTDQTLSTFFFFEIQGFLTLFLISMPNFKAMTFSSSPSSWKMPKFTACVPFLFVYFLFVSQTLIKLLSFLSCKYVYELFY